MEQFCITIDGCAGVGKSAVANALSKKYHLYHVSMGVIFRAFTWCKLNQIDIYSDKLEVRHYDDGEYPKVIFEGIDITENLYNNELIDKYVSDISGEEKYQLFAYEMIRNKGYEKIVVEGRNTKDFFPKAKLNVFLDAENEECFERYKKSWSICDGSKSEVKASISNRNNKDQLRRIGSILIDEKNYYLNTTDNNIEETVQEIAVKAELVQGWKYKASVITTVYGKKRDISYFIELLLHQSVNASTYEVIIVCDPENNPNDDRVKTVICEEKGDFGLSYYRNRGIDAAEGEIIIFLDSDMLVNENFISNHLKYHDQSNNIVLLGARKNLEEGTTKIAANLKTRRESRDVLTTIYSEDINFLRYPWMICYGCNVSLHRRHLLNNRFNEAFRGWGIEDIEWAFRLNKRDINWIYDAKVFAYHLFHRRDNTEKKFGEWKKNLILMQKIHNLSEVRNLSALSCVFDPDINANYMEIFDLINKTHRSTKLCVLEITGGSIKDAVYRIYKFIQENSKKNCDMLILVSEEWLFYMNVFSGYLHRGNVNYMVYSFKTWSEQVPKYKELYQEIYTMEDR